MTIIVSTKNGNTYGQNHTKQSSPSQNNGIEQKNKWNLEENFS